ALLHWGLIPSWAKDTTVGYKMINARSETIMEKPSFKKPFQKSRCLVAADGFFEWSVPVGSKSKIPMRITLQSREPFAMAGLWEKWKSPEGKEIRSFTIITTAANKVMEPIHNRMPVILSKESEDQWLDPESKPEKLLELLRPYR